MDCNIKLETEIRRQGKWEEYEKKALLRNYIAEVRDRIQELQHFHDVFSKPEYLLMNEQEKTVMMFEKWNVDVDTVKSDIQKDIDLLKKNLEETIAQYGTGDDDEQQVNGVTDTIEEQTTDVS
jgi:uncharacterized protein YydD (DUF2326 family)